MALRLCCSPRTRRREAAIWSLHDAREGSIGFQTMGEGRPVFPDSRPANSYANIVPNGSTQFVLPTSHGRALVAKTLANACRRLVQESRSVSHEGAPGQPKSSRPAAH